MQLCRKTGGQVIKAITLSDEETKNPHKHCAYTDYWQLSDSKKHAAGGEEGIRTLDRLLTYTRFPGVRLQPLIHLSAEFEMISSWQAQVKISDSNLFPFQVI